MNKPKTNPGRLAAACVSVCLLAGSAWADELTLQVEQGLAALGYDTGPVDGTETLATTVAISKFQAQHQMDVTGEVSPELLGRIVARANGAEPPAAPPARTASRADGAQAAPGSAAAPAPGERSAEDLQAARQACLQKLAEEREKSSKVKRGFGSLARAVGRTTNRFGVGREAVETAQDAYTVKGIADDLSSAASDFGLTAEEAEPCRNP